MAKKKLPKDFLEKLVPVLLVASIALAFAVGVLWQKVSDLNGGSTRTAGTNPGGQEQAQPQQPTRGKLSGKLSEEQASKIQGVTDSDHIRGNRNAQVYLIEYSDYECPFCQRFHSTAQQVVDEYDNVGWVYRHFPLDQIHPQARPAAVASECVSRLAGEDAFWQFTDYLFENQQTALTDLEGAATRFGVSVSDYNSCIEDSEIAQIVEDDYQGGLSAGVTGTPGNIIINQNGDAWLIPGALPFEQIKTTIDEALN